VTATPPLPDFDSRYREGTTPWDLGRPQPEIVRLAEEGEIVGEVLDVGCGTGDNALHLASLGLQVLGVDASPTAIGRAQEKAAARGLAAEFRVADALHLERLRRRFETAIDCGLFHVFEPDDRRAYARSLTEVLSPGSTLHVLCFSDEEPPGYGPKRIAEYDLRDAFRGIFTPTRIRPARFEHRLEGGAAKAWLATFVRI
jgi:cyclopropane fatty-acyl-phospholipid synthase-like methyltransferase